MRAVVESIKLVGALLFVFLLFKVPVTGAYKLTTATFAAFKWLVVLVAVLIGIKNLRPRRGDRLRPSATRASR